MKKFGIIITLLTLVCSVFAADPNDHNTWSVNAGSFTYSMNITAKLNINCVDLENPSNKIAAFVGNDCRGVEFTSSIVNGEYLAFLTVYSNSVNGESIKLYMYNASIGNVVAAADEVAFQDGAAYGFPSSPYITYSNHAPTAINLTATSIDENAGANALVGTMSSVDQNSGQTHSYSFVAGTGDTDNGSFSIDGNSLKATNNLNFEVKSSYSVRIRTTDNLGCFYDQTVSITVNDVNDDITAVSLDNSDINENASVNAVIGNVIVSDEDQGQIHQYFLSSANGKGTDNDKVTLSSSGLIRANNQAFNFEAQDELDVQVRVIDGEGSELIQPFTIAINDLNDTPTEIVTFTNQFAENLAVGTTLTTLSTTDEDAGDTHNYSFATVEGSDNASFTIVDDEIRSNVIFNFEEKSIFYLYIISTDAGGATVQEQIILTATDQNDTPTNIELSSTSCAENQNAGALVAMLSAIDEDANDTHTYSLVAGAGDTDNAMFQVDGDQLKTSTLFDFETKNQLSLRLQVNDGNATYSKAFTISVTDNNDTPYDLNISNNEVYENLADYQFAILSTSDYDANDAFSYALVSGSGDTHNSQFKIIGNSLYTKNGFDYESANNLSIRVKTTDEAGASFEKTLAISILDANDKPYALSLSNNVVAENANLGTPFGLFTGSDEDANTTFTYAFAEVSGNDNANFTIVGNELRTNLKFNYEDRSIYYIYVNVYDQHDAFFQKQFTISIDDANDIPTDISINNLTIPENQVSGTFIGKLSTTDEDENDTHLYFLSAGDGDDNNNAFEIRNDSLFSDAVFDYETQATRSLRVSSSDGNGTVSKQFTVSVIPGNDAPYGILLSNEEVVENANNTLVGVLSTLDSDAEDTHTYSLVSGTGSTDNAKFKIIGDQLLTNVALDFETLDTAEIRIKVSDLLGSTFERTFKIAVEDQNDVPQDVFLSTNIFDENLDFGSTIANLSTLDEDADETFTYELTQGEVDNALFSIVGSELRTNSQFDFETKSSYFVKIKVTDQGGLSLSKQFSLTVNNTNDIPTDISLTSYTVKENKTSGQAFAKLVATDQDPSDNFTFSLVSGLGDDNNSNFNIFGDSLYVNTNLDFETQSTHFIRVRVSDGTGSYEKSLTIGILDAFDAPTAIELSSDMIAENKEVGTLVATLLAIDVDAQDSHTFSFAEGLNDDDNSFFVIEANQLVSNAKFNYEAKSQYKIRIKATDAGNLSYEQFFIINIIDENDAPTSIDLSTLNFDENIPVSSVIAEISAEDPDANDELRFEFANNGEYDNHAFQIVGNKIVTKEKINYEVKRKYVLNIRVIDIAGASFVQQFVLDVNDKMDAPTAILLDNASFWEESALGTYIGTFEVHDQDVNDQHTFQFVAGMLGADNSKFMISNDSLFTNTFFDFNAQSDFTIKVKATDKTGLSIDQNFSLFLKNSNNAPTSLTLIGNDVDENLPNQKTIGYFVSVDPDSGDGHQYTLVPGEGDADNGIFEIVNGILYSSASFDFETKNSYSIRVRTTDFAEAYLEQDFVINVNNVNDRPSNISLSTNTFNENLEKGSRILRFTTTDQDAGASFTYTFNNDQQNDNNMFAINGDSLVLDGFFNFEEKELYTIRVTSTDEGGLATTKQFIVNVNDINDAPTLLNLEVLPVYENDSTSLIAIVETIDEDTWDAFNYGFIQDINGASNGNVIFRGDSLFLSRPFNFEASATASLHFYGMDLAGMKVDTVITLDIIDVNDKPTDIFISNLEIAENSALGTIIGAFNTADQDKDETFTYTLVSGDGDDNNAAFFIAENELKIATSPNYEIKPNYSVRIKSTDSRGLSTEKAFTIEVLNVNEAPILEDAILDVPEDFEIGEYLATLSYLDNDLGDQHTFNVVGASNVIAVDELGDIYLNSILDYEDVSVYPLQVSITDQGGLSDTANVLLRVVDVIESGANQKLPVNKIISPNGDGKNDAFQIENVHLYKDYSLSIYNEAGGLVYQVNRNYSNDWQATYNGKPLETGSYYYVFVSNLNPADMFKGVFSVIK
ncbi:cadherin domain-containing protein [Luteibaculum oceani]|uniref:T9SS type B sorting domain-containing protein n=1 Tax=Luteibaculum oceani TaxID=1294296 RepID=A0A5C6UZ24_9FLAO|nr:cadherin domain-containing protein [Luteibaculum oceani]TXC78672.1 T9SS type B sorting domain-containing protein [Luteibaculum oceani]